MTRIVKRVFASSLPLLLLSVQSFAFELPLSDHAIREAYFIGQHHDESTQNALKPYVHNLSAPQTGPYISDIRLLTPYAQVIDDSNAHSSGYSAQQAAADYHLHADLIVLRVHIQFTPTYGYFESASDSRSNPSSSKGIKLRSDDFWQVFKVGLSQNDQWIEPVSREGEATYAASEEGGRVMTGAYIWLVYGAQDVTSAPATAEVLTPDGQHITSAFDLASLR